MLDISLPVRARVTEKGSVFLLNDRPILQNRSLDRPTTLVCESEERVVKAILKYSPRSFLKTSYAILS